MQIFIQIETYAPVHTYIHTYIHMYVRWEEFIDFTKRRKIVLKIISDICSKCVLKNNLALMQCLYYVCRGTSSKLRSLGKYPHHNVYILYCT
jgi:hypothetical protein